MHARVLAAVGALSLLAGCLQAAVPDLASGATSGASDRPRVVVAVIDTGMNLYHEEFRRPGATPPAYLPADVEAVALDLTKDDFEDAHAANNATLMTLEPHVLYTFPGTKVVGAISFVKKPDDYPLILDHPDRYTHGTMTTSRAVGNTVSIPGADPDVDLVLVQGFNQDAVEWVTNQPWIDIVSISAGISPLSFLPATGTLGDDGAIAAYQAAAHTRPFFASTGNGVMNGGLVGFPSWLRGSSGAPDVVSVGGNDNDRAAYGYNQDPYVSSDTCGNPRASPDSTDEIENAGGGTSSATPFSAGGGARMLLEARRLLGHVGVGPVADESLALAPDAWDPLSPTDATVVLARASPGADVPATGPLADGVFTLADFKDVLYHTALPLPTEEESDGDLCNTTTSPAAPGPEGARFALFGYGEVNAASIEAATAVLRGDAEPPARPDSDIEYARAHDMKSRTARGG